MRRFGVVIAIAAAVLALGATALLPARVEQVARSVEEVRGRRFQRPVPASEIDTPELKKVLRSKLVEAFPVSPELTLQTLSAFGLIPETPRLVDRLVDFYASQVIAFYDPETRRFYVVRGAEKALQQGGAPQLEGMEEMGERLIFAHELTHALQDETLRLDRRLKELKDNGDRALAMESLLEGEATVVMVRVAVAELPGAADSGVEEMLAPLLSAGALERANVPKDIPDYFVEQLFFPYTDGTAFVRDALKKGGWEALDRLWKSPPESSAEILHPGRTSRPENDLLPARLDRLATEGRRFLYSDTNGEWGIRFVLRRQMESAEADAVASGWRGDRIAFFSSSAGISWIWKVRLENPGAAAKFEIAWKKARAPMKETVTRTGRDVLVTSGFSKPPEV
jgi:hypothetical protein